MSTFTRCNCSTKLLEGEIVTISLNRKTIAVWTIDERTLTFLAIYHLRRVLGFMPSLWIHGKHDKGINKYILHAHTGTMTKHASCFAQLASIALGIFSLGGKKRYNSSLGPPTVSREPHMRCRPTRRSNCTPQLSPKNLQLQSLRFGAMKAQCSQACFCACKSSIWNGRQFPFKRLIYKSYISYISYIFISSYIVFILYTSKFIPDRLDYLRHASRVSRIGALKPIKHNSRTPAFCDRRFFHSRDRQASGSRSCSPKTI